MGNDFDFEKEVDNFSEEELIHIQEIIAENLKERKKKEKRKIINNILDCLENIIYNTDFAYDTAFIDNDGCEWDWTDIYNSIYIHLDNEIKIERGA